MLHFSLAWKGRIVGLVRCTRNAVQEQSCREFESLPFRQEEIIHHIGELFVSQETERFELCSIFEDARRSLLRARRKNICAKAL
jgi:hypothetical protein